MKNAILFDMDGLMLETKLTWQVAEKKLLEEYGKEYSIDIARKYQGMRASGVVEVMIKEYSLPLEQKEGEQKLTDLMVKNYENPALTLLPGCKNLVNELTTSHKFFLAIASSSPKAAIAAMVKRFDFRKNFDVIVSGEEVRKGKPAPDIFLKCAELLHVKPHACLVLEDAPSGIKAAKAAGMKNIAVYNRQFYKPADFIGIADRVVMSLEDLSIEVFETLLL